MSVERETPNGALIEAVARGDQQAWEALVDRYSGLLWNTTRQYRLSHQDAADVVQATWLRLLENLDRIGDPDRLAGWLVVTARGEALRALRPGDIPRPDEDFTSITDDSLAPGEHLVAEEDAAALWAAMGTLSENCQRLLRMLISDPPYSYAEIAEALDMKVGSIGPTRQRCLRHLRIRLASLDRRQDAPRTPADQVIGSLFAAAEMARLSHEPSHDEAAALRQFNAWLDGNTESTAVMPQQSGLRPQPESG